MRSRADYLLTFCLLITAGKLIRWRHFCFASACRLPNMIRSRLDRDDALDLDRNLIGQHHIADSRTGMTAGVSEHFDEQIGATIDDLRRIIEVRRRIDHAEQLDDEVDTVERAEGVTHGGEQA